MSTEALKTETGLSETEAAATNSETSSADADASNIQTNTLQAVEAVGQRVTPLPAPVRARVEELFTLVNASRLAAGKDGGNWSKSPDDKRNIIELVSLLSEYSTTIPELAERTEKGIFAQAARKYLKSYASISPLEARVIELLRADLADLPPKEAESRRVFNDQQKKGIIALAGLLRKKYLGSDGDNLPEEAAGTPNFGANEFLSENHLSAVTIHNWKHISQNEQGVPYLTSELARSTFRKAQRELDAESAPAEVRETLDPPDTDDVIFHKSPFKPADTQTEQETVTAASSEVSEVSDVTPAPAESVAVARLEVRSTLATVLGQNQQVIEMLRTGKLTTDDKRILAALLEASNLALASSEGISLGRSASAPDSPSNGNDEAHQDSIVIRGNEIMLSPNTTGTLTMTETTLELGRRPVAVEDTSEVQQ